MHTVPKTSNASDPILQLGIVGFGKLGLLHASILNALPGCRFAALADNSSTMLSLMREWKPDVECYEDYREMLRASSLDAVFIATPTHLHIPVAVDCVAKNIPVFIEKPLSIHSAQALPLMQALEKNPVKTMVGYMSRFNDTFRRAHQIIQSGELGRPQTFRATMYVSQLLEQGKGWRYDKEKSGGGVLITQNSHLLDLLLWIFGDLDWVSGHAKSLYSEKVEDAVHCYMQFKNGMTGWIDTSWSIRHYRSLTTSVEVQTELGTLSFNDDEVKVFLETPSKNFKKGWTVLRKPDLFQGVAFDIGGPHYTRQLEEFLNAIRGAGKVGSDVTSAYRVQKVVDAIYQSAENEGIRTRIES